MHRTPIWSFGSDYLLWRLLLQRTSSSAYLIDPRETLLNGESILDKSSSKSLGCPTKYLITNWLRKSCLIPLPIPVSRCMATALSRQVLLFLPPPSLQTPQAPPSWESTSRLFSLARSPAFGSLRAVAVISEELLISQWPAGW